jgi:elongation factor Ts
MAITASMVKELREATGLGMMACKKALEEADGNMDMAVENLRKQGQATAAKRAGKAAKEGRVAIDVEGSKALIYEVNSETDFVARNDDFVSFANELGTLLMANQPADMDSANALTSEAFGGNTVEAKLMELVGKIGEKISFRRFAILSLDEARQQAYTYVHGDGRIGVIVILSSDTPEALKSEAVASLGKDIAMQVAASNPMAIKRENVPAELVEKEREIYTTQAKSSGKPEKIWDRIVDGKLNKFFGEVTLVEQAFIKDPDIKVQQRVQQAEKEAGCTISIDDMVRYELGAE